MHFRPLSTHVKESNAFQTLIYLSQGIQLILDPYLLTLGNLTYPRPLFIHASESNLFQTLIYSRQGIQCISNPYLLTSGNLIYLKPLSTHVKDSNALQTPLFMLENPMLQTLTLTLGRNTLTLTQTLHLRGDNAFFV